MSAAICPECRNGKHVNCHEAFDEQLDQVVDCACGRGNHVFCGVCETPVQFIECPTGGWWAHLDHPHDDHDAVVEGGGDQ